MRLWRVTSTSWLSYSLPISNKSSPMTVIVHTIPLFILTYLLPIKSQLTASMVLISTSLRHGQTSFTLTTRYLKMASRISSSLKWSTSCMTWMEESSLNTRTVQSVLRAMITPGHTGKTLSVVTTTQIINSSLFARTDPLS